MDQHAPSQQVVEQVRPTIKRAIIGWHVYDGGGTKKWYLRRREAEREVSHIEKVFLAHNESPRKMYISLVVHEEGRDIFHKTTPVASVNSRLEGVMALEESYKQMWRQIKWCFHTTNQIEASRKAQKQVKE